METVCNADGICFVSFAFHGLDSFRERSSQSQGGKNVPLSMHEIPHPLRLLSNISPHARFDFAPGVLRVVFLNMYLRVSMEEESTHLPFVMLFERCCVSFRESRGVTALLLLLIGRG